VLTESERFSEEDYSKGQYCPLSLKILFVFQKSFTGGKGCGCSVRTVASSFWFELIVREAVRENIPV